MVGWEGGEGGHGKANIKLIDVNGTKFRVVCVLGDSTTFLVATLDAACWPPLANRVPVLLVVASRHVSDALDFGEPKQSHLRTN